MKKLVLVGAILAFLPACTMRATLGVDIKADGSGEMSAIIALDSEARALLESFSDEEIDWSDPSSLDIDPESEFGATEIHPYEDGDFLGFRTVGTFDSPEDVPDDSGFKITVDGTTVTFLMEEDLVPEDEAEQIPATAFDVSIRVKMPGKVTSHNATEVASDGTLVWKVDMATAAPAPMAVSDTSGGSSMLLWIGLAVAAVALIAAYFVSQNRRKPGPVATQLGGNLMGEEE